MIEIIIISYTEKYQAHIPCSFGCKAVCVDDKFSKLVLLYRGKNVVYKFMEQFLKSILLQKNYKKAI